MVGQLVGASGDAVSLGPPCRRPLTPDNESPPGDQCEKFSSPPETQGRPALTLNRCFTLAVSLHIHMRVCVCMLYVYAICVCMYTYLYIRAYFIWAVAFYNNSSHFLDIRTYGDNDLGKSTSFSPRQTCS